jgi:hypothetical protein
MTNQPISSKEKKLRNLRKILLIVFTAITIVLLMVTALTLPAALLINRTTNLSSLFAGQTGLVLLSVLAIMLVKIAFFGIICLLIYFIFKYRLDKDDDLFL